MKSLSLKKKLLIAVATLVLLISVFLIIFGLTFSVTGTPASNKVVFTDAMAWNDVLRYDYRGYDYTVTKNVVPPALVGRKLTVAVWFPTTNESGGAYDGYAVKFDWNYRQITFKTKYGYLLANKAGKTSNRAVLMASD
jgi:hypothetical protein